jgi:hypothetical protein
MTDYRVLRYQPPWRAWKSLIRTLARWVYGPKTPRFAHVRHSPQQLTPPGPLPPFRERRLSISLCTSSFTKTPKPIPNLFRKLMRKRDKAQCTSLQNQCPLFTRLPLELRVQIYRFFLGDCTFHIIPSHVASLTLPPRFSLRAHPFQARLDFEVCADPEQHIGVRNNNSISIRDSHRDCTGEGSKEWASSRLRLETDYQIVTTERILQKWGRKGGPLALLKTCRVMYALPYVRPPLI